MSMCEGVLEYEILLFSTFLLHVPHTHIIIYKISNQIANDDVKHHGH